MDRSMFAFGLLTTSNAARNVYFQGRHCFGPQKSRSCSFKLARSQVMSRPPLPPFSAEAAAQKARLAEDAWNTREPARVAQAYTPDSIWRNRAEFIHGREEIVAFLTRKWNRELDYRLIKEVWAFRENRIAVRFAYEWHDDSG